MDQSAPTTPSSPQSTPSNDPPIKPVFQEDISTPPSPQSEAPVEAPISSDNLPTTPMTITPPESPPLPGNQRRMIIGFSVVVFLLGGLGVGVFLVQQQQNIQEKAAEYSPLACPISPAANRYIANFDGNFIRSDREEAKAKLGPVNVTVPAGNYKVTLVSYEKDHPQSDSQPKETWFLKINNGQGNSFAQTSAIGDMADSESIMTQVVNNDLSLSESANSVTAFHAAYPDTSSPNSINPVCAVFEKIQSEIAIKCHGVKAYSEDWTELSATDLSALKAGDKVRFSVSGSSSSGNFDKAQFTINGTARAEVQSKKPGSEEFYDEFTIPAGVQSFNVTAKVHHTGTDKWI